MDVPGAASLLRKRIRDEIGIVRAEASGPTDAFSEARAALTPPASRANGAVVRATRRLGTIGSASSSATSTPVRQVARTGPRLRVPAGLLVREDVYDGTNMRVLHAACMELIQLVSELVKKHDVSAVAELPDPEQQAARDAVDTFVHTHILRGGETEDVVTDPVVRAWLVKQSHTSGVIGAEEVSAYHASEQYVGHRREAWTTADAATAWTDAMDHPFESALILAHQLCALTTAITELIEKVAAVPARGQEDVIALFSCVCAHVSAALHAELPDVSVLQRAGTLLEEIDARGEPPIDAMRGALELVASVCASWRTHTQALDDEFGRFDDAVTTLHQQMSALDDQARTVSDEITRLHTRRGEIDQRLHQIVQASTDVSALGVLDAADTAAIVSRCLDLVDSGRADVAATMSERRTVTQSLADAAGDAALCRCLADTAFASCAVLDAVADAIALSAAYAHRFVLRRYAAMAMLLVDALFVRVLVYGSTTVARHHEQHRRCSAELEMLRRSAPEPAWWAATSSPAQQQQAQRIAELQRDKNELEASTRALLQELFQLCGQLRFTPRELRQAALHRMHRILNTGDGHSAELAGAVDAHAAPLTFDVQEVAAPDVLLGKLRDAARAAVPATVEPARPELDNGIPDNAADMSAVFYTLTRLAKAAVRGLDAVMRQGHLPLDAATASQLRRLMPVIAQIGSSRSEDNVDSASLFQPDALFGPEEARGAVLFDFRDPTSAAGARSLPVVPQNASERATDDGAATKRERLSSGDGVEPGTRASARPSAVIDLASSQDDESGGMAPVATETSDICVLM